MATIEESMKLVRHNKRPNALDYIHYLFPDFIELSGDRLFGDDSSIIGGICTYHDIPLTVIAQVKGRTLEENLRHNFSMSKPEGYRKALRLMQEAEMFKRPIICFVDTLGAYPGEEAEERGQGSAIANNLMQMSVLRTPIISILIGDGGSGGALALSVSNEIAMLENAVLGVISPKACANILWKDSSLQYKAAKMLKMSSQDMKSFGIADYILPEPAGGAHNNPEEMCRTIDSYLFPTIKKYMKYSSNKLVKQRNKKFRTCGNQLERES